MSKKTPPPVTAEPFDAESVLSAMDATEREGAAASKSVIFKSIQENQDRFATRHDLERKARIRMAALKRFMPLILGVIHRPGADGPVSEKSAALSKMMDSSYALAEEVCRQSVGPGVEVSGFIEDQALSVISEIVATNWAFNGSTDVRRVVMDVIGHMAEMGDVIERIASSDWRPGGNVEQHELSAGLTMSLLKASEPIHSLLLDYRLSNDKLFQGFQDLLVDQSLVYLDRISDNLPPSTRLAMVQNHLSISSRILKVALVNELNRHKTPTVENIDVKEIVRVWQSGMRMLETAVESKVKAVMDGLIKVSPKAGGMEL